jgi:CheY-like chemotaxis protein
VKPSLITLDIRMSGIDGWQVLSIIRSDPNLADIPVIVVSITNDHGRGFRMGASDYITKPVDSARFAAILKRHRAVHRERRALLVDEDAKARTLMRYLLVKEGWEVVEAVSHAEALELVKTQAPAIVITGLNSEADGALAFLDAMRGQPEATRPQVLVVASEALSMEDREALSRRMADVLVDGGWTVEELLAEVRDRTRAAVN